MTKMKNSELDKIDSQFIKKFCWYDFIDKKQTKSIHDKGMGVVINEKITDEILKFYHSQIQKIVEETKKEEHKKTLKECQRTWPYTEAGNSCQDEGT